MRWLLLLVPSLALALPLGGGESITTSLTLTTLNPLNVDGMSATVLFDPNDPMELNDVVTLTLKEPDGTVIGTSTYTNSTMATITNCNCFDIDVSTDQSTITAVLTAPLGQMTVDELGTLFHEDLQSPSALTENLVAVLSGVTPPAIPFGDVPALQTAGYLPYYDDVGYTQGVCWDWAPIDWAGTTGDACHIGLFPSDQANFIADPTDTALLAGIIEVVSDPANMPTVENGWTCCGGR